MQGEFFEALVEAFRLNGLKYLQSDDALYMLLLPLSEKRTRAKEHSRSPQNPHFQIIEDNADIFQVLSEDNRSFFRKDDFFSKKTHP